MKIRTIKSSVAILFAFLTVVACNNAVEVEQKNVFDEYKASPLAELMRKIADDFSNVHTELEKDSVSTIFLSDYNRIKFAEPTPDKKADVETNTYKQMADAFLFTVEEFNKSSVNRKKLFNAAVVNCMNCHNELCPGPLMRIKKLPVK